jgi:hypothetical protein
MKPPTEPKPDAATALRHAEKAADAARSPEDFTNAIVRLQGALADQNLHLVDRVRGLAHLASAYRRSENWAEAERAATSAVEFAEKAKDPGAKARAKLEFGTVMVLAVDEDHAVENADPLGAALASLDEAAQLYQSLDSVDFYASLLAIARALEITEQDSRGVYARITRELVQEKWVAAGRESPELARQVDYLRGRAFFGLGSAELARGDRAIAADRLEAARELLTASRAADVSSIIERIDELLKRLR